MSANGAPERTTTLALWLPLLLAAGVIVSALPEMGPHDPVALYFLSLWFFCGLFVLGAGALTWLATVVVFNADRLVAQAHNLISAGLLNTAVSLLLLLVLRT